MQQCVPELCAVLDVCPDVHGFVGRRLHLAQALHLHLQHGACAGSG